MEKTIHQGHNVKRFREMMLIKQEALASMLGDDWSQKKISLLEQKEDIDDALLQQIAVHLKVPVEAIKNFDEEAYINIIGNTFSDNAVANARYCTFNPIEKMVELYDALLKEKDEKVELLKKMLEKK